MDDYKSKIIYYLLVNSNCDTGKFNFQEMANELDIPFDDVVKTIKELQEENVITLYCPKCSEKATIEKG